MLGASGQPSASYAAHMFEVSASMPPSQVLRALPEAEPGASNAPEAAREAGLFRVPRVIGG